MSDHHGEPIHEPLVSPVDPAPPLRQHPEQHRQEHVLRTLSVVLLLLSVTVLLLSQGGVSLLPSLAHLLTPVPTATPRPGHFIASSWERLSLPQGSNLVMPFPVPNDPTTLYACAAGLRDATGRMTDGPATL
jgi:hypothetical protein